jgi:threonine synthase
MRSTACSRPARAARTMADSICVARPRDATKAVRAIRESAGFGVKVSDREIKDAIGHLAAATSIFVEPAAAAAFAGFIRCCGAGQIKSDESVLLVLTGHGLKDVAATAHSRPKPLRIQPNIADLMRAKDLAASV